MDIDLTWLPVGEFAKDVQDISAALEAIGERLRTGPLRLQVQASGTEATGIHRLIASRNRSRVQIETTPVMRGTVHPVRTLRVSPGVERDFGFAEMQVLDFADLYAGKLCAALSRQHPRDLFDMQPLLDGGRLDEQLWRTFLVYLTCSSCGEFPSCSMRRRVRSSNPSSAKSLISSSLGCRTPLTCQECGASSLIFVNDQRKSARRTTRNWPQSLLI